MHLTHSDALDAAQVQAAADLARTVQAHDGVAAFDEDGLLTLDRPGRLRYLLTRAGDGDEAGLLGFAQVHEGSGELAVHPDHRRQGLGHALVRAIVADHPQVRLWAHGDLPGAQGLAAAWNMTVARQLWVMGRPAPRPGEVAPPQIPEQIRIRTFQVGADEQAWLAVNARAFADHPEQGRIDITDLRARMDQHWFDPQSFWLAEDATTGVLLGSMWVKVTEEPASDGERAVRTGEIYVLGVDPAAQGRGVGSLLTTVAMEYFSRARLDHLVLYVEGDNTAAIRTYRKAGFERDAIHVQYTPAVPHGHPRDATIGR